MLKKDLADEFFESQYITDLKLKSRIDYDKPLDDFYEQLYILKKEYLEDYILKSESEYFDRIKGKEPNRRLEEILRKILDAYIEDMSNNKGFRRRN